MLVVFNAFLYGKTKPFVPLNNAVSTGIGAGVILTLRKFAVLEPSECKLTNILPSAGDIKSVVNVLQMCEGPE